MRHLLILIMALLFTTVNAQISKEEYDKFPPDLKARIEKSISSSPEAIQQKIEKQLETTSKYVEIGHGIGVAVNETLQAIESTTVSLSETRIGKIAIGIAIWKLIGVDLIKILVHIAVGTVLLIYCIKLALVFKRNMDASDDTVVAHFLGAAVLFVASMVCFFSIF